jgi:hypothetical protein
MKSAAATKMAALQCNLSLLAGIASNALFLL